MSNACKARCPAPSKGSAKTKTSTPDTANTSSLPDLKTWWPFTRMDPKVLAAIGEHQKKMKTDDWEDALL